jgi:hypothetical protein
MIISGAVLRFASYRLYYQRPCPNTNYKYWLVFYGQFVGVLAEPGGYRKLTFAKIWRYLVTFWNFRTAESVKYASINRSLMLLGAFVN